MIQQERVVDIAFLIAKTSSNKDFCNFQLFQCVQPSTSSKTFRLIKLAQDLRVCIKTITLILSQCFSFRPYSARLLFAALYFRSIRLEVFCKNSVLENLAKFTGKHMCWGLFFNKVAGLKNNFFYKTPPVAASDISSNNFD